VNPYSCLVDALAILLEVNPSEIVKYIGHDGSQIIWPELEVPKNGRGFSIQELQDYLHNKHKKLLAPIDAMPGLRPTVEHSTYFITFPSTREWRFHTYQNRYDGILTGTNHRGNMHAWAVKSGKIIDPAGKCRDPKPLTFWILSDAPQRLVGKPSDKS
jgi:hypothetical protein